MASFNKRLFYNKSYQKFKIALAFINFLKIILVLPISLFLIIIYPIFKIRLGRMHSKSIGNYVSTIEIFLYESKHLML